MKRNAINFGDWPIDDLKVVTTEQSEDEEGLPIYCLYSKRLDSITFIKDEELTRLRHRGIREIESLPEQGLRSQTNALHSVRLLSLQALRGGLFFSPLVVRMLGQI